MRNNLIRYNNFDNINYKGSSNQNEINNNYNKYKKKRKYIACNYNWKVFYSDDEDNNDIELNDKNTNAKNGKKRKYSQSSISTYKEIIHKKSTIDSRVNGNINNIKNIVKLPNKKVRFPDEDNFVKFIDIESYKKYNSINTNDNQFLLKNNEDKADLKCTCFIF